MNYYEKLKNTQQYSIEQDDCIVSTVNKLSTSKFNESKPALLFGEIQSGKTRTFIGIIANSFDKGYDITIVLTKSTIALTEQTYNRLDKDFAELIDNGYLCIYNIMKLPLNIPGKVLNNKLIFVVKKQKHNLERLEQLFEKYDRLNSKKVLIIDDEADYASIGFKKDKSKEDGISVNVIMSMLNNLRKKLPDFSYLQVTATPYCLYLQPSESQNVNSNIFFPNRPEITAVVPTHSKYIGGKYYFEFSENEESPANNLFLEVSDKEIKYFNKKSTRKNDFDINELKIFKQSLVNYIFATAIRCIQEESKEKHYKSSCLIHIDKKISEMNWQFFITNEIINKFKTCLNSDGLDFKNEIEAAYLDLSNSILKTNYYLPELWQIIEKCKTLLNDEDYNIPVVNSENDVLNLLDRKGQLRLDTTLNIFIGGDVLDRGITIENMISFFYGRNPITFQQDTVLQHSRMYGARNIEDMAVTRLYTTARIYFAMKKMYEFDRELRDAFLRGENNDGVIFVPNDLKQNIQSCNPSKILITSTLTIKPLKRFLPIGFDIKTKSFSNESLDKITEILKKYNCKKGENLNIDISLFDFYQIVFYCNSAFDFSKNNDYKWDVTSFLAIAKQTSNNDKVHCFVKWNRKVGKLKYNNTKFQDSPEDGNKDLPEAKNNALENPSLILLHQLGEKSNNWSGHSEFFWPVLVTPKSTMTAIFATE